MTLSLIPYTKWYFLDTIGNKSLLELELQTYIQSYGSHTAFAKTNKQKDYFTSCFENNF